MSGRAIPHFRAQALGLAAVVVSAGIIMSCDSKDGVMDPGAVPGPTYEIFDGSGLGSVGFEDVNPHFFFLPPLVDNPSTTGVFDPAVAVGVQIFECELGDGVLVGNRRICYGDLPRPVVAEFDMTGGTGGERVDMTGEHYQVNWHTDESPVSTDVTKFYRIVVSYEKGGDLYPLGHVDVQFGRTGKDVKNINRSGDDFIGLKDGRTLPLKFRIEEFAATFAEQSSCLSDPELVDCDVETVEPGGSVEQQVAVWAEDNGRMEPAGVVTFTPGSVPPDGITVVLKYWRPETWDFYPSPEIPDAYEIPPFLTVELFNEDGTEYTGPDLGGDGARLAWCHDIDDESVDISNYAIYMVDEEGGGGRETQVLETGPGEDCELLEHAYAPQPDQDGSFLSRLKDGLSRVASSLTPQPLKAMHGGLNTEGPIRRFSDFGAVDLAAEASVGPGAVGEPTTVTVRLLQGDGGPVGGDGSELYVGPTDEPDDNLFVVEVTGGPNVGAEVTAPVFDPADGTYSASYTPTLMGEDPDEILVTVFTRIPQYVLLESQVYGHESCIVEGILDCDVAELDDDATVDQQLVVWVQDSEGEHHPAGAVSFSPGSLPVPGITAVLKYIDPGAPNYPPSPEIPDDYEIPPFLTVELYLGENLYTTPLLEDGAQILWCHDEEFSEPGMGNYAVYRVDDAGGGDRETEILETGPGADCELLEHAYAPQPDQDGSFLSRLKDGLSRVASSLTLQPLKAMHGGLNTEGPIRRFSDFGAVDLTADASVGPGAVGEPTTVTVRLSQGDGGPVGGDGSEFYVGPTDEADDNLVVVEVTGGPNVGAEVSAPVFDPADGTYSATYTPTQMGEVPDEVSVTVFTREPQFLTLQSQVYEHEGCLVDGIKDCDVAVLDPNAPEPQQLVVWVQDSEEGYHPAGGVTIPPASIPPGADLTAVVKYIDPVNPNYPPSPEIPDQFELEPYLTVELYDNQTGGLYNEPLVGDGAELLWCHDEEANPVSMDNWAIYKVDTVGAGPPRTVILETESGPDCELLEYGYAPVPDDDGSFLGRLKDGLSQVAMSLTPQPLKAMHGGLNTEGPIRRFSDFGAVNLVAGAVVEPAVAGDPIAVTVRLLQGDGFPVGGAGGLPRVGPSAEDGDDLVVVEVIGGPNLGAVVTAPVFDPLNGTYTFTYTPAAAGTDQIRVTAHTRVPQTIPLTVAATAPVFVWEGDSRFVGEDGHKQVGSAGELLTNPAKVRLVYGGTDPAVPVTDEDVTFSFRDRGLDVSATTDSEGYVTSEWRLSDFGESNLLTITAPIADPVEFWALALGQISKWTADGEGWEEDVVGVNDIGYWPRDPDDPDLHDFTKESGAYGDVTVAPGAGVIGDAFSFGPTGGYISAHARDNYFYWNYFEDPPGTPFYDNNITVSAWVWLEPGLHHDRYQHFMTVGNSRAVMEATEAGVPGMPGHFKFYVNGNDPGNGEHYPIFGDMQPMQTGCFYHIAGTLNGSVARAYLNGELFGEVDAPLPEQLIWANQVFLSHGYLGSEFRPNQDGNFVGLMDEPEIWNVALDGAEIAEIYNNPAVDRGKLCQNYDLRGRVLYSNQVLGGVQVSVYSDIGLQDLVASATTGEFGDYYFSDITPGTYWIVAEITSPYSSTTADSHLLGTAPVYHDVQVQKPILNTSPDNPATVAEIRPTLEWTPIAESEAGGYYEVWIHQNSPWQQVHSTVPITQTPSFTLDVDLTPGQSYWWTITAYDQHGRWVGQSGDFFFTVEEPGTDISGTVAYSATPVEGIQVLLHDEATMEFVQEDFTDADGNYLLSEIPDGDYVVTASTPYPTYIGNPADTVSLSGGSLDIDFQIQKPIVLTAPDDDSNTRPTQPVIFEWEANAEAQAGGEYWVQIMEAVGPDPEVFVFNNITTNSVGADLGSVGLIPGMVYNWTVKAFDEDANLVGRTELPRTFKHGLTIAGYVTVEGSTPAGVTLDLSGQWSASTQTDGTGFYKFTGLPESGSSWNITVSDPSGNMTFTPNVKSATPTLVVDSVEVDFTGSYVRSASISGGVSSSRDPLPGTTPLKNVELTATGPDGAQTTLLSVPWDYSFTGLRSGAFRVEVTQGPPEMTFTPAYLDLILGVGEARDGVDFLGEGSTGTISGTITSDGVPLSGVEVIIDGWTGANATTGALGQYSFAQIPLGDYTITLQTYPGDVGFPMTQTLAALSSDGQTAVVDFAGAYVRTASISGQVTLGGTGLAGVDVTSIGPDQTLASTTDLDGNYAFPGLRAGAYTVTMAQPSTFYFPVMSYDTAVAVGETLLNLDFPGIDPGPFDTWDVSVLAGATTLCNGDPGVCSGVADVTLAAVASYPATELIDPWDEVEFHWSVAGSGVWTELGTTTSPTLTDDGITRFYTYQMSLLGTGLPPGPIEVRAVGVLDNDGPVYYETLSNSQITVVSGSAER